MSVNSPITSNEIKGFFPPGIVTGLGIIAVALVVAWVAYGALPYSPDANKGLALLIFIAILWFTEAVHISLTAIMIPIGAVLLQLPASVGKDGTVTLMTMKSALAGFADPIIYLFLGGFALATALQVQKIDKKIASGIISIAGSSMLWSAVGLCAVTAFLSMWISNTATAAMILPLALGLLSSVDKNDRGTRVFVLLAVAYSSSIGGMGMLQGSPPNGIAATQLGMGFTEWMRLDLPVTLILMPAMFITLWLVCKPNFKQKIQLQHDEDIPWTGIRILTLVVFALTALAWILGDQLETRLGITNPDTFVALCAIIAVVVLGLASWKDVTDNTDWGVLLLFGGGITLSSVLGASGASKEIGQMIASAFGSSSPFVIILVVATFIIFLTEFTSNTASAALLVPVFASVAAQTGMREDVLVMVIGIGASCAFMLPVATPPNALVFGTGEVKQRDMFRAGFVLNIVSIAVVTLFAYYVIL